ncbi:uncharacterized protein LOC124539947 [Vanessa cardui]|uniref:uncharacterized protein LOC124539947 n=1 Tax=Vanessa cardui TaxID=171605 RepID=UPI001F12E34E|nr:uncharacterized protein LOC124539947 [Vanessa cardui]
MLFFMYVFLIIQIAKCSRVGSTLFYKRLAQANCWSEDDLAKLRVRKIIEEVMPPPVTPDIVNDNYITESLKYFRNTFKIVDNNSDKDTVDILKEVLADAIGAHMRSEILPTARFAYYAGYASYRNVKELHDFFDDIKILLNTQGIGWKKSDSIPPWTNFTVEKVRIGPTYLFDPCARLVTKRDSNSCIHIPAPMTDDHFKPSAIALPWKSNGLFSLVSPLSENVLLKYYTAVSKCILHNSPDSCRHSDFVSFNNDLWHWMKRDVAPRLTDEKLYAAYGGILRIAAAVQNYGKGLHRRNLFDIQDPGTIKWHPWKTLKESYVYINTDWTPHMYIAVIVMIGLAICILQVCYSYITGNNDGCPCRGVHPPSTSKDVAYAKVESNIPAMLPSHQSAVYFTEKRRPKVTSSKTKSSSLGSLKKQKVYDMHENTEKLMAVIMSDNEGTSEDSAIVGSVGGRIIDNATDKEHLERPKSPPKIETPITQMKIEKTLTKIRTRVPMYSTSTVTNSEQTCLGVHATDSWTGSCSSTSTQSVTSASTKSRFRKSKSSRDLAWARRVVSKHSLRAKSTSGTELDINSYTTPPSQR